MHVSERARGLSPVLEKASILVVEHSSQDAERMVRGLRETAPDWEVETASSGKDCLLRLAHGPVSAIVLDRDLPDANGLEILDKIVERNYPAPVIWVTEDDEGATHHALQEGAYDYVVKDEDRLRQLPQVVRGALRRYRLEQEHRQLEETLEALLSISRTVASSADLEEAQGLILEKALELFGAPSAWLLLMDSFSEWEVSCWRGGAPGVVLGQRFFPPTHWTNRSAMDSPPFALSLDEARPFLGASTTHDAAGAGIERVWVVPLTLRGRVAGLLIVFHGREAAGESERGPLWSLRAFASALALAIENSRLRQEAREALTERQHAQQKMEMTEKLRMLGAMASGIVHDFNNVLAVIKARAGLAKRRTEDPALLRDMDIVMQASADGTRTVRRLQEMVGIHKGRSLFAPVSLNRVVQSAVELTRPRWKDQAQTDGIALDVRLDLQPVPEVAGSEAELREALINLIFNALDAMPQGGRLTLATRHRPGAGAPESGGSVVVTVQDTGHGLAPETLARAFDPFYTTKGGHHTGLGLSICQNIIDWHGGEVRAESRPGQGSTFTVSLPVAASPRPGEGRAAGGRVPGRPVRVLFIDDEQGVREYFHEFLEAEGHTVASASTGDEGLMLLQSQSFDAVVTDLGLPGMSGWEVARRVHARNPETPILLLTGLGEPLDPEAMKASGITEVLKKPFEGTAVLDFVARYARPANGG